MKLKISKQGAKRAKQGVGLCLLGGIVAGSLFLGCSSDTFSDNEFKPSNEMEERAYKVLKEKYPNVKVVSYEFADKVIRKERSGIGDNPNWKVKRMETDSDGFNGYLYVETLDEFKSNEKWTAFEVSCSANERCYLSEAIYFH